MDAFKSRSSNRLSGSSRSPYGLRDGRESADGVSPKGDRMFLSLGKAAEAREMLDVTIGSGFADPRWRRRERVPFLANGGGGDLQLDVAAEAGRVLVRLRGPHGNFPSIRDVPGSARERRRPGVVLTNERATPSTG